MMVAVVVVAAVDLRAAASATGRGQMEPSERPEGRVANQEQGSSVAEPAAAASARWREGPKSVVMFANWASSELAARNWSTSIGIERQQLADASSSSSRNNKGALDAAGPINRSR